MTRRAFLFGGDSELRSQMESLFGAPLAEDRSTIQEGDLVVLDAEQPASCAFGNAFSDCRDLKRDPRIRVFIVIREEDPFSAEIARFCLADGVLLRSPDGKVLGLEELLQRLEPHRSAVSVDELLARLEREIGEDRRASIVQKMLTDSDSDELRDQLNDPETGLLDGAYASLKLDEEFKRAMRFHQPLSLLLLDCGIEEWPEDSFERRTALAEIASIFLNECRDIDVLSRFTERVFLFLLPGTGSDGARAVAERMLGELRQREFSGGLRIPDARAGLTTIPDPAVRNARGFLTRGEACLQLAAEGRGTAGLCSSWE